MPLIKTAPEGLARNTALILLTFLLLAGVTPAQATMGDCGDPGYRARFNPRIETVEYDCVERLRLSVSTEDGERDIRLLHDRDAGWAVRSETIGAFENGIRAAASALRLIGPFGMDHVTVLLIDDFPPREGASGDFSDIAAETTPIDGECLIGVYLLGAGGRTEHAAYVIAHEIFHCVQAGTLSASQISSGSAGRGAGGDWWLEGSADWFAALALPEPGPLPSFVAGFDSISAETPLYDMAYEAVVLFLWLNDQRGPTSIIPFLRQMAGSPGASAQRAAMQPALGQDQWLAFAQAYIDREIKHPHGSPLSVNPAEGEDWTFSESRTQEIALEPFVIHRGRIEFECGRWGTEVTPDQYYAVRTDSDAWGDLPNPVDTREGGENRFRFVGLAAATASVSLRVEVDREAACEPCQGISEVDACLVGAWERSGGGPVEWMREVMPGFRFSQEERSGGSILLKSDGTYLTTPLNIKLTITAEGDDPLRTDGSAVAQAAGRWSAKDGKFNLCQDSGSFAGQATFMLPDAGPHTTPLPDPGSTSALQMDYTCSAAGFETRLSSPGFPRPMVTRYSRIDAGLPSGE